MKIILIATLFYDSKVVNLGVGRLAAFLNENNHQVQIKHVNILESPEKVVNELDSDCSFFGFSAYYDNMEYFLKLSKLIKRKDPNAIIVYGSKFISLYYDEFIQNNTSDDIDFFILGDGEYTLLELVNCVETNGDINELAKTNEHLVSKKHFKNKKSLSININQLPLPIRDMTIQKNKLEAFICDSHGCVGSCSFCTYGNYHTKWNGRSAESLFDEVRTLYQSSIRLFVFTGSSFEDPGEIGKQRIQKFCELILASEIKACFRCFLRAETFSENERDINLLHIMKKAGFHIVCVGIESGNIDDLKLYNKKSTLNDNYTIMKLLSNEGIYSGAYGFIMFNPYSTLEGLKQNYQFISMHHPYKLRKITSKLGLFRNTPIYDKVKQNGLLISRDSYDWNEIEKYAFVNENAYILYKFIKDNFYKENVFSHISNIEEMTEFIYSFIPLLDDQNILINIDETLNKFGMLSNQYFHHLFIDNDIDSCQYLFADYVEELQKVDMKINIIKNKIIRKLFL